MHTHIETHTQTDTQQSLQCEREGNRGSDREGKQAGLSLLDLTAINLAIEGSRTKTNIIPAKFPRHTPFQFRNFPNFDFPTHTHKHIRQMEKALVHPSVVEFCIIGRKHGKTINVQNVKWNG